MALSGGSIDAALPGGTTGAALGGSAAMGAAVYGGAEGRVGAEVPAAPVPIPLGRIVATVFMTRVVVGGSVIVVDGEK